MGEAGLEPAHPLLIRQGPLPVWPLSRSAGGDRTRVIRIMSPALEPLSYRAVLAWHWSARRDLNPLPLATSRVSDECSYPVSYEPAEDGGVEPRGLTTATSFQSPLPRRRRIFPKFPRGTRRSRPPPPVRSSAFEAAPATWQVLVPRMAADTIRGGYPSFAFQTKPARLSGSPSTKRERANRTPRR